MSEALAELDPVVVGDFPQPIDVRCDGLHVLEAPEHYLCTRCFPNGRECLNDEIYTSDDDDELDELGGEA